MYFSFSSQFFETAVGPKPRSNKTSRALTSNQGDTFFQELDNSSANAKAESYTDFLQRKNTWDNPNKQVYLLNAGVPANIMDSATSYVQAFLGVPCAALTVRSVSNGLRFVQEHSVPGSCGEGGCQSQVKATAAHDVLAMLDRTAEAESGAIVVALTSKHIYTEWAGVTESAFGDTGRLGIVSTAQANTLRAVVRLVLRTVVKIVGFVNCGWMQCIFNSLQDSSSSIQLDTCCPGCLRRISDVVGSGNHRPTQTQMHGFGSSSSNSGSSEYDYLQRYSNVYDWYGQHKEYDHGEQQFIAERYFAVAGKELSAATAVAEEKKSTVETNSAVAKQQQEGDLSLSLDPSPAEIRSKLKFLRIRRKKR